MRALITGATGLLGTAVVEQCLAQDIGVNFLTTKRKKLKSKSACNGFFWNPKTGDIDPHCIKGVQVIIHLAGETIAQRWTKNAQNKILESRIASTKLLFQLLKENPKNTVRHFITASAIGIYPSSLGKLYDESSTETDNSFSATVVKNWELAADRFLQLDISVAKVRLGIILSDKAGALPKMLTPIRLYLGSVIGNGKHWQSWIHIQDAANIFAFIISKRLSGVYNAVAPNPVTQKTLTVQIAKTINRPVWLPNIPKAILKIIFGKMSEILLSSQAVSSKKIEAAGFCFEFKNLRAALTNLLG